MKLCTVEGEKKKTPGANYCSFTAGIILKSVFPLLEKKITPVNKQRCSTSFLPFGLLGLLFFLIYSPRAWECLLHSVQQCEWLHLLTLYKHRKEGEREWETAYLRRSFRTNIYVCVQALSACLWTCGRAVFVVRSGAERVKHRHRVCVHKMSPVTSRVIILLLRGADKDSLFLISIPLCLMCWLRHLCLPYVFGGTQISVFFFSLSFLSHSLSLSLTSPS